MLNPLFLLSPANRRLRRYDAWWSEPNPLSLQRRLDATITSEAHPVCRAFLEAMAMDVLHDDPRNALRRLVESLPSATVREPLVRYRLAYLASRCGRRDDALDYVKDLRSSEGTRFRRCIETIDYSFTMTSTMHELTAMFGVHEQFGCLETAIRSRGYKRGVEVGVFMGYHARHLLEACRNVTLVCVDLYGTTDGAGYDDWTETRFESLFREVQDKLSRFERATFKRMESLEAARTFGNEDLDFVYLDADHRYEAVKADIDAWARTVRSGGTLGGHDYAVGSNWDGVKQAVDEWAAATGRTIATGPGEYWESIK